MNDPNIEEIFYSDAIDELMESTMIDDDSIDYDDLSFGALLDSSNDF